MGSAVAWSLTFMESSSAFKSRNESVNITVIHRCYVIGGSKSGDVSRDRFSHKRHVKMWMVAPASLF